jgi:hypothetical protein
VFSSLLAQSQKKFYIARKREKKKEKKEKGKKRRKRKGKKKKEAMGRMKCALNTIHWNILKYHIFHFSEYII